jgi:hypothetical protein
MYNTPRYSGDANPGNHIIGIFIPAPAQFFFFPIPGGFLLPHAYCQMVCRYY